MGRVADAYDRALRRPVAIKEMLSTSAVDVARFEREARITARLEHPGIVPIHDAGRAPDGTPFYVMRRVDGRPLGALIEARLEARLALIPNVLAACDAVAFAHARGIVHRDIKPTNILVGPFGETLVIDWGIAREIAAAEPGQPATIPASDQLTRAGTVAGTPGFMAPEQARGEAVDARADVFALGATLFYVLTGQLPYGSSSATEMVELAGAGREPDWRQLSPAVPPELRAIARKAMASRSAERYPEAGALAADLRRFITGNLVAAYDYGPGTRLLRFVRRHRAALVVAAISALIVIAGAALSVRRIVAERDDANAERSRAQVAADRLRVQHARELADSDPVAAVMALRTIPATSPVAREAWSAAAAAYVHGIPFGFASSEAGYIKIARDSTRALVAGWRNGTVTLLDLHAHTARVVTSACTHVTAAAWLGPDHAVCLGGPAKIVDLRTGAVRPLSFDALAVWGDRASKVWLQDRSGTVLELDDPAGTPREIARGVETAAVSDDLGVAVFQHGASWEVRTPTQTFPLPIHRADGAVFVSPDRVAFLADDRLQQWRIERGALVDDWTYAAPQMIAAIPLGDRTFVLTPRGLLLVHAGELVSSDPTRGYAMPTPNGLVQLAEDGSLRVYDGSGWLRLQRKATGLRHADVSPDGRIVVATTSDGETLTWDLRAIYPMRATIPAGWTFLALSPTALWMWSRSDGIGRLDLATGKLEIALALQGSSYGIAAPDDRWVAAGTRDGHIVIVDNTTGKRLDGADVALAIGDATGLTMCRADGALLRWRPGGTSVTPVGSVGGNPEILTAAGGWIAADLDHHLVRVNATTGRQERIAAPDDVAMLAITPAGAMWALAGRSVWGWDVGAHALVKVPTAESIEQIAADEHGLVMGTSRAITTLVGGVQRVTPIASATPIYVDQLRAVVEDDRNELTVIDLATGLGFELPDREVRNAAIANGDRVAAVTNILADDREVVSLWTIDLPRDPFALAAWLGTITNAQPIANSEVYTWPW